MGNNTLLFWGNYSSGNFLKRIINILDDFDYFIFFLLSIYLFYDLSLLPHARPQIRSSPARGPAKGKINNKYAGINK